MAGSIINLDGGINGAVVPHVYEVSSAGAANALLLNIGDLVIRLDQNGAAYVWDGTVLKAIGGGAQASNLVVGTTITNAVTLTNNQLTPVNATGGVLSEALPTGQTAGSVIAVMKTDSSVNAVNITGSIRGVGAQTETLVLQNQVKAFVADGSGSWWPYAEFIAVSTLDSRYDASGAAATAQTNAQTFATSADTTVLSSAQTFATSAVNTEQTRATTAEALKAPIASPTFTGVATSPAWATSGLTGAVAASRYAGGTASGAPASGTFLKGDFIVDQTGTVWVCTVAGSPGTWVSVTSSGAVASVFGRSGTVVATTGDYAVAQVTGAAPIASPTFTGTVIAPSWAPSGLTGAVAASRYVGATASGAPVSGTFVLGDFAIDQTGKIWICTTGGTPGTWTQVSSGGAVSSVFSRTGVVVATTGDYAVAQVTGAAPLASPTFTGVPAAPTAVAGTNTTQLATTAFITTALTNFAVAPTFSGLVTSTDFAATGLTGASSASRYVGATASGAPLSGTFVVGDFIVDRTGSFWVCTTAGTPGTWTQVATGGAGAALSARSFSGTTDTLVIGDANNVVESTGNVASTETVPLNSIVAFPLQTIIEVFQLGAGQVTISGAGGGNVSIVQEGDSGVTALASGTAWNMPGNVANGNCVVMFVRSTNNSTLSGVTGLGATWHSLSDQIIGGGSVGELEAWYTTNPTGGTKAITPTFGGGGNYYAYAIEWQNVATVTGISGATATSTTPSLTAANVPAGGAAMVAVNFSGTMSARPGSPWIDYNTGGWSDGVFGLEAAHMTTATLGSFTANWTQTSANWVTLGVLMSPASSISLLSDGGKVKTAGQYATVQMRQRATNSWVLSGDLV